MKKVVTGLVFLMGVQAHASMECMGKASDGNYVSVKVTTAGDHAKPLEGLVSVFDGQNTFGYPLNGQEIAQYYERTLFGSAQTFVGLVAYAESENPVDVYYSGANYADQDLRLVLDDPTRSKSVNSQMLAWKGPGYAATEQYQIEDIVCGVWAN